MRNELVNLCQRAQRGEPSCWAWLWGESASAPDDICLACCFHSLHLFARERFLFVEGGEEHRRIATTWPQPLGTLELGDWYQNHDRFPGLDDYRGPFVLNHTEPLKSRWQHSIQAYRSATIEDLNNLDAAEHRRMMYFSEGNLVRAGLAAKRKTPEGTAWVIGLVAAKHPLPIWGFEWENPAVLIEAYPTKSRELAGLVAESDKLIDWYNKRLLGKPTPRGGGPTPKYTSQEECRTAVVKAIKYQLGQNSAQLQKDVAAQLGFSTSALRDNLTRFHLNWLELVKEARVRR